MIFGSLKEKIFGKSALPPTLTPLERQERQQALKKAIQVTKSVINSNQYYKKYYDKKINKEYKEFELNEFMTGAWNEITISKFAFPFMFDDKISEDKMDEMLKKNYQMFRKLDSILKQKFKVPNFDIYVLGSDESEGVYLRDTRFERDPYSGLFGKIKVRRVKK